MIGVGRGSMLTKLKERENAVSKITKSPGSIGRGTTLNLMTPDQFSKGSSVNAKITPDTSPAKHLPVEKDQILLLDDGTKQFDPDQLATTFNKSCIKEKEENDQCNTKISEPGSSGNSTQIVDNMLDEKPLDLQAMTDNMDSNMDIFPLTVPKVAPVSSDIAKNDVVDGNENDTNIISILTETKASVDKNHFSEAVTAGGSEVINKSHEKKEDEQWKLYQVERKINKLIKGVTHDNVGEAFNELECLMEERPLSSRYIDCSEVKILIEVLTKNAVQRDSFLPLAPCFMKMVSEHQPIEFTQYFNSILDTKCKEFVTLSASDEHLNSYGQHFCKFLGHLFCLPRQTGTTLFDIVKTAVRECVERWSCPEGTELVSDGLKEQELAVYAAALKCLLLEITERVMSCDEEVQKEMKRYIWLMRESILNSVLPRKVREIYLDGIMEIHSFKNNEEYDNAVYRSDDLHSSDESVVEIVFATDEKLDDDLSLNVDPDAVASEEEVDPNVDFENLRNPPIDSIAMAPTNTYESRGTIPLSTRKDGYPGMAMKFLKKAIPIQVPEVKHEKHEQYQKKDTKDVEFETQHEEKEAINCPSNVLPAPKKLPMGRGKGLVQLKNMCKDIPVANVSPIGYHMSENKERGFRGNQHQNRAMVHKSRDFINERDSSNSRKTGQFNQSASVYSSNKNPTFGRNQTNKKNWKEKYNGNNSNQFKSKRFNFRSDNMHDRNETRERIPNPKTNESKEELEKFYHSNGRLEYRPKPNDAPQFNFGSLSSGTCMRCNSTDHASEDCTEISIFF